MKALSSFPFLLAMLTKIGDRFCFDEASLTCQKFELWDVKFDGGMIFLSICEYINFHDVPAGFNAVLTFPFIEERKDLFRL